MENKWFKRILFSREEIEQRCKEIAQWIDETYKDSKNLILVGIMKGSIPFLAQVMKDVNVIHNLDFMTVSSFEGGMKSTGNLKIVTDLKTDIADKDVLIIEDIIDSGKTMEKIVATLELRKPNSLKVATLLDKPAGRKTKFEADIAGFEVPHIFLAGFGLDVKGKLRNVPFVGEFNKDKFDEL